MKLTLAQPLLPTLCALVEPLAAAAVATPSEPTTVVCRSVTIHADCVRLADDLERELRLALGLDGVFDFGGRLAGLPPR